MISLFQRYVPISLGLATCAFSVGLLAAMPWEVRAEGCPAQVVTEVKGKGVVNDGARVRDAACSEGSRTLEVVSAGTAFTVTGKTDGWYRIQYEDGTVGYIANFLLDVELEVTAPVAITPAPEPVKTVADRVKGYILLQVEEHGEAWYVDPVTSDRYYMKDGPTAYEMMRQFGLGMNEADFARLERGASELVDRLRGRIVLRVEEHGEAYYVHPETGDTHYLENGEAAYSVMRNLSLGVTNNDLAKIAAREIGDATVAVAGIQLSSLQQGEVPSNIDLLALNEYWLKNVNELRAARGLRLLELDQRWVDTATEWAAYNASIQTMTHDRPDGKSMHQWIDTKGLDFTTRYSTDGWKSNYFTENLSWNYTDNSQAGMEKVLDWTLDGFLAEAPYNGSHYRTTYHADWNSVGLGFYFIPWGDNKWRVYNVFHYGSLNLE